MKHYRFSLQPFMNLFKFHTGHTKLRKKEIKFLKESHFSVSYAESSSEREDPSSLLC